jgi:hypothetical protein
MPVSKTVIAAAAAAAASTNAEVRAAEGKMPRDAAVVINVLRSMVRPPRRSSRRRRVRLRRSLFLDPSVVHRAVVRRTSSAPADVSTLPQGVTEWEPRVVNMLMEFIHRASARSIEPICRLRALARLGLIRSPDTGPHTTAFAW